ncbi:MAG: glucosidase [Bacteroidota bacterium]
MPLPETVEHARLAASQAREADWKLWGPYVSERAWGTVREDYSARGDAWGYFPHDHARSRAYRWNEDGLAGFCNRYQNLCLGLALWNEQDAFLKERLFGLAGPEGNHGEDVKEYYFYLDALPSHAYGRMLYKYPQVAFPYEDLVQRNAERGYDDPEYELIDALPNAFAEGRYFDVVVEYAKADEEDILCRITAYNRGPDAAPLHLLPHIWYRNFWSWQSADQAADRPKPALHDRSTKHQAALSTDHHTLGTRWWYVQGPDGAVPPLLFTENETHHERLHGSPNASPYVKDAFHRAVVHREQAAVHPAGHGTKAAAHIKVTVPPGEQTTVLVRFAPTALDDPFGEAETIFAQRLDEADAFYDTLHPPALTDEERRVQRQAFAGLLWTKQFYHYSVTDWLEGDPGSAVAPPDARREGRNADWHHLYNFDVVSMPDKWEYPWYAAWDLAFHMLPTALLDPEWAKRQMILMTREWYMHPNGQLPAYEWAFDDVNPPVHAWGAWRVYKITRNVTGQADTEFLEKIFHKMLLNFTWWVNRKDASENNIFQGGFLGLDNIGVFDRSQPPLPDTVVLEQADGTAWMGMYCLNMLAMALELAREKPAYEDVATKFFEHFVYIADAINKTCADGLWDDTAGFYYDALRLPDGGYRTLAIDSFVGLIPLFAVETLEPDLLDRLPRFRRRMAWFKEHRPHLLTQLAPLTTPGQEGRLLLSLVDADRLRQVAARMLDPAQFLSDYGIRSLSKRHAEEPFNLHTNGTTYTVHYEPAESRSGLFGGNSNWRGPVWFPVNYLLIESLQKYHHYYGADLQVELPVGTGRTATLDEVADDLAHRLCALFVPDAEGRRPFHGSVDLFHHDPHWRDHLLFHEYFHGDTGRGAGASHQTGWTALVAKLLMQIGHKRAGTP